jgi:hypothetical protein
VERVVLNALPKNAALPPNICACGDSLCHRLQEKPIPPNETDLSKNKNAQLLASK